MNTKPSLATKIPLALVSFKVFGWFAGLTDAYATFETEYAQAQ
uniref:Uncharacterized protein n=1 Tax=Peronospora matthiolae TaxID=2874970 RepID=A0AAV1U2G1_9STRA